MRTDGSRKKSALTVVGGVAAAVLAGLLALVVNLGIMRAAGSPPGPGRLGSMSVERLPLPSAPPASRTSPRPGHGSSSRSQNEREFGSHADD